MLRRLIPGGTEEHWRDPSGSVAVVEVHLSPSWVGQRVSRIEAASGTRVALLTRLGKGMLPDHETVLQEGDLVHVALRASEQTQVEEIFAKGPEH
jgi:trk system potassium uptake protein TrkA